MPALGLLLLDDPTLMAHLGMSRPCRYCCKSLCALLIKNSKGYRRDVRVNMWGTSSPDDKLLSDLAKTTEAIKIAARRSYRLMAGKLSPLNFGLLQQYRHKRDMSTSTGNVGLLRRSRPDAGVLLTAAFDPEPHKREDFAAMHSVLHRPMMCYIAVLV